jgi:hypothetical protein
VSRLGDEEGFGIFLGDGEELEGGVAWAADALLPAADGVGANVELGGEERLAGVECATDAKDFADRDLLWAGGELGDTQVNGLAAREGGAVKGLAHVVEDV